MRRRDLPGGLGTSAGQGHQQDAAGLAAALIPGPRCATSLVQPCLPVSEPGNSGGVQRRRLSLQSFPPAPSASGWLAE
jgi:hypothetical protein